MINLLFTNKTLAPIHMGNVRQRDLIYRLMKILTVMLLMLFTAAPAFAGTQTLGNATDSSSDASVPVTDHLMVTIPSSAGQGGNDATSATVSVTGTVAVADVAEVAAFYQGLEAGRLTITTGLTNLTIDLPGNTKGGQDWTFFISLNASAGGKTFGLSVDSIAGTTGGNLPFATPDRNATGAVTAPTLSLPTATSIDTTTAILGATIDAGTGITDHGTVWNTTGPTVTENPDSNGAAGTGLFAYSRDLSSAGAGQRIYYRGFATNSGGTGYSSDGSFYLEPTQASGVNFSVVNDTSVTVAWTNGSNTTGLVVMYAAAPNATAPADGTVYTASTDFGAPGDPIGNGFVVFAGTGTEVTVTGLTESTQYWVRVYAYSGSGADSGDNQGINYQQDAPETVSDTTTAPLPVVSTPTATGIDTTAATLGATVASGTGITDHGTVWNTTGPTITQNPDSNGAAGTGAFAYSRDLSSAGAGQRIYYRGFAASSSGTGYSSDGSFYLEPLQASSVTLTGITDVEMTVNWINDASSDGALVVMYQGAADGTGPTDGTLHSANNAFGTVGTEFGTGYVVYRGTAQSVPVTGLTASTLYTVKVFAYAGAVADSGDDQGINYQQDTPAQGSDSTSAPLPVVSTPTATNIDLTTATLGATIDADNGASITDYGTVWGTSPLPTGNALSAGSNPGAIPPAFPFSHSRDLSSAGSGTQIFYRGYATNSGGTAYSSDGAFYLEPSQASGVGFESVGSTSMTITWTAGGGDGAIVVVKEGSAVDVGVYDPVDGTEHTFSSNFLSALDLGGGNKAVYRGPANSAPVSGLTADTTYYVAVYEYAGTGSGQGGINYQQDLPATDSQATTTSATGHNAAHNITKCDQCHAMHGGYGSVPYGSNQETVCKACHNETQMGAENPQLWDVGMHEVTKGGPQTVDCGSCHDVHNGSGVTAVGANLKRVRRNTTKYIPAALEPALYEVQDEDFAFDENSPPWNGICQSCHTNSSMKWHTNASQASEANPHNHNMSGGVPNPVCTVCHTHSGGFAASGGSCNACHDSVKNAGGTPVTGKPERRIIWNAAGDAGDFIKASHHATNGTVSQVVTENDCAVCHVEPAASHMDGVVDLKDPDTGATFTITDLQENPSEAVTIQNNLCLKCHDLAGAVSTWNSTEGASATQPFSNNTGPVPDVFSQFDTANNAFHPVRGTTGSTGSKSTGITASTMNAPWTNVGNQTMTCFDCHENNAHGSDYQKMLPVEDPASPGTYYGIDFNWYETYSGDMSKATTPTPSGSPPAAMDTYEERIEVFCTKCHNSNVYVTGTTNGVSVYEYHGQNQQQHSAAGGNQLACLGCHAGIVDQNGGVVVDNGAWNGNVHGVAWDWETDGGLTFGSKNWPGTPPADSVANNFLLGGWLSGWSAAGECGGGNCNHSGSADRGGGQSYSPAID